MSINQHNYELFILDYYEGKLDAASTSELMLFLGQNPEAREAFESYEVIMLTPDFSKEFEPKSSLKKTAIIAVGELTEENYENYCIESIENNLSAIEISNLKEFLFINPQLQKTFETYKNTILQPELSVVFDRKEKLKKADVVPLRSAPLRRFIQITASAAAITTIVLLSGIIIQNVNTSEKSGSYAFSVIDLNIAARNSGLTEIHNNGSNGPAKSKNSIHQTNSQVVTFADINPAGNKSNFEKLQKIKETQIESTQIGQLANNSNLTKRDEYTGLIDEREILLSRRNKIKSDSREEGLADYVVKGIKNAARTSTKNKEDIKNNHKIGFWDVAGFGVYAYNKITDNNLTLDKETDASGRLMTLHLEDKNSPSEDK